MHNSAAELSDVDVKRQVSSVPTTSPRRIACVIHSLDGGGAERVMARLADELGHRGRGHDVHLVTLDDGRKSRYDVGVIHHPLDVMRESKNAFEGIANNVGRIRKLRRFLRDLNPDVILSFCDRTNVLTLMAARPTGIPVVVSERSDPARQSMGWFWDRMRDRTYRRAAAVIAQTSSVADYLSGRIGRDVAVVPSAVEPRTSVPSFDDRWQRRLILGVGRYEHEKGFDRLIDAFAKIADQHTDWRLRLVGDGSLRTDLIRQRDALGLSDRIDIDPWQGDVDAAYRSASLFALPSRYEGFPAALLEAMASGLPVVAVRCPSGPAAIIGDDSGEPRDGLLVGDDVDSLAAGLKRMMESPELACRLAARAPAVTERFGWPVMVQAYEEILLGAR